MPPSAMPEVHPATNAAGDPKTNGTGVGECETAKEAAFYLDPFYKIIEQPLGERRHVRIACMGAGYSGLMMAIVFSERLQGKNAEFVVYERNVDLGGTWLENRSGGPPPWGSSNELHGSI